MRNIRPALFRGRHCQDHLIVLCVRWYLRYCLTLRDLEELMAERGLSVDHATIGRWVLRYAPECTSGFAGRSGIPIGPGVSIKPIFASPANGRICTAPWIPPAKPSTLCSRRSEMRLRQNTSCNWPCGVADQSDRE